MRSASVMAGETRSCVKEGLLEGHDDVLAQACS